MYKQKLEEQIKRFEALQDRCGICDISEFIELSQNILSAAKKIDEIPDETEKVISSLCLDSEKISETIKSINLQSE